MFCLMRHFRLFFVMAVMGALIATSSPGIAAPNSRVLSGLLRTEAIPLTHSAQDYDRLIEAIGDASVVMLGESTHGSEEFYRERIRITQRLITEKQFDAVIFESPWEPMRQVDAYVTGINDSEEAAFSGFDAYPRWPRDNPAVRDFVQWLRDHNRSAPRSRVRFWGMDLYSVQASARSVIAYLDQTYPDKAAAARRNYRCFDDPTIDLHSYGQVTAAGQRAGCGAEAQAQRADLQILSESTKHPEEAMLDALQSAELVASGEHYHRMAYRNWIESWNLRERFLAATIRRLMARLTITHGRPARIIIWAHNTHIGDARATDQLRSGELSLGQLLREQADRAVFLVGFSTNTGGVRASTHWGGADREMTLQPALPKSWPALLQQTGIPRVLWIFRDNPVLETALDESRLSRAIGVNYLPEQEKTQHYSQTKLSGQFDALIHLDQTSALKTHPLHAAKPYPSSAASR